MTDIANLFERQAKWQKSLRNLPWPEKVRLAAKLRLQVKELRQRAQVAPVGEEQDRPR